MSIPTVMRALVQTSLAGVEDMCNVNDAPVPVPQRGEVLIRVAAAGVNFVDITRAHGRFGNNPRPPFVAGFEAAGEVVSVGDGGERPQVGAQVIGAGSGAFAEYMLLPAMAAMPVPAGWTAAQALGLVVNWPTALAALKLGRLGLRRDRARPRGRGATGQATVRLETRDAGGTMRPDGIVVLEATASGVSRVTAFHHAPELVASFGTTTAFVTA